MFEIEEATTPTRERNNFRFPFDKLGPSLSVPFGRIQGPSFFVPASEAPIHNVRSASQIAAGKLNCRFSVRKVEENGVEGCRVWRMPE